MFHKHKLASLTFTSLAALTTGLVGCDEGTTTPPTGATASSGTGSTGSAGGGEGGMAGMGGMGTAGAGGIGGSAGMGGTGGIGGAGGTGGVGGSGGTGGVMCVPVPEICGDNLDNDCDMQIDNGCICTAGTPKSCYEGPAGTSGVGTCMPGVSTCAADGKSYGPCVGQITPVAETCDTKDNDCNGTPDEGCSCVPGVSMVCYSGPMNTAGVGSCKSGMATCLANGQNYGPCVGEILPQTETCNNADDDCDGMPDDNAGCICSPGSMQMCYSGPAGTSGVGVCKAGSQTCAADGMSWGMCTGEVLPSPENCATTADDDCNNMAPACLGTTTWVKTAGNNASQISWAVATDKQGNGVIVGQFAGTMNFGPGVTITSAGSTDIFVAKYDAAGTVLWAKRYGDVVAQRATGVAIDSAGNIVIVGDYAGTVNFGGVNLTTAGSSDIFVAKLDAMGNHVWSSTYGNVFTQLATSVAIDGADNAYIGGSYSGNLAIGGNVAIAVDSIEALLFKVDAAGNALWAKGFTGLLSQFVYEVAANAKGEVAIAGAFETAVDFGGGTLTSAGNYDLYVAKFDAMGNHVFSKRAGDVTLQRTNSVAIDANGNVAATGEFNGTIDLGAGMVTSGGVEDGFIVKYDAMGNHTFSKTFGGASAQRGQGVAFDAFGNILLTGQFWGTTDFGNGSKLSNGNHDLFIAKYDPTGKPAWVKNYGGANEENGLGITADLNANVWVTGSYMSTMNFGTGVLTPNSGSEDAFVMKLAP